jgi:hypothetical protein
MNIEISEHDFKYVLLTMKSEYSSCMEKAAKSKSEEADTFDYFYSKAISIKEVYNKLLSLLDKETYEYEEYLLKDFDYYLNLFRN